MSSSCLYNYKSKDRNFYYNKTSQHIFCVAKSSRPNVFCKKCVLTTFAKFTEKHLCQGLFFEKFVSFGLATLIKLDALADVVSCEFSKNFKNTFFYRTPVVAVSGKSLLRQYHQILILIYTLILLESSCM